MPSQKDSALISFLGFPSRGPFSALEASTPSSSVVLLLCLGNWTDLCATQEFRGVFFVFLRKTYR